MTEATLKDEFNAMIYGVVMSKLTDDRKLYIVEMLEEQLAIELECLRNLT